MNQVFGNQFILILIMFGLSFLSWLFKRMRERYVIKQARMLEERRREEALRTGRHADHSAPQHDTIAQRQAAEQARRAREQAAAQRRIQTGRVALGPASPGSRPAQGPSAPFPRAPMRPAAASPPARRPAPSPRPLQPKPQRQRPAPRAPERAAAPRQAATLSPLGKVILENERSTQRLVMESAPAPPSVQSHGTYVGLRGTLATKPTTAEWKRAIMLSEILGPPVSQREDESGDQR